MLSAEGARCQFLRINKELFDTTPNAHSHVGGENQKHNLEKVAETWRRFFVQLLSVGPVWAPQWLSNCCWKSISELHTSYLILPLPLLLLLLSLYPPSLSGCLTAYVVWFSLVHDALELYQLPRSCQGLLLFCSWTVVTSSALTNGSSTVSYELISAVTELSKTAYLDLV